MKGVPERRGTRSRPPRRAVSAAEDALRTRNRLWAMVGVFGVLALLPLVKLVGVQFTGASEIAAKGLQQRQRTETVPALRGSILDRNGVELAVSVPATTVAVNRVLLTKAGITEDSMLREFATTLAGLLHTDPGPVSDALLASSPTARWVMVARYVDPDAAADAVKAMVKKDMDGVLMLEATSERIHPGGDSGVRVIGTVGPDGPGPRAGIEAQFDRILRGTPGKQIVERGTGGETITDGERVLSSPRPGRDVRLTLDRTLQYETEQILSKGSDNARAAGGIAIVGRPSTGELLSVAGVERNERTGAMELSSRPLAFSNAYQAGSVFKLVTTAAAYEAGVIDDASTFTVPQSIQVKDRKFSDNETHGPEQLNVDQIVAQSSNVGTIQIAQRLGADKLHQALVDFGFGRRTALDHPAESPGLLPAGSTWTDPDTAAAAIGSFQSTTVVQLWSAYNVIANQGIYVPPRLVEATTGTDGRPDVAAAVAPHRVVSATTAARVARALRAVVQSGTARQWDLPGFPMAAKTGTGRMPSPEKVDPKDAYIWPDGVYHHVTTLTGYFPVDRPQVSITVMIFDAAQGLTGSTSAGPVFSDLARLAIRELSIAPTAGGSGASDAASTSGTQTPVRAAPATAGTAATDRALLPKSTGASGGGGTTAPTATPATASPSTSSPRGSAATRPSRPSTRSPVTSTTMARSTPGRSRTTG